MRLLLISLLFLSSSISFAYQAKTVKEHRSFQKFVEVEGGKIAYIDEGKGKAILLVHGVPTSSWLYRHMIPELVNAGYRVIAPDLLGYGNSEKPKTVSFYDADKQAKRLIALMDSLNIETWEHICHDAGGVWTWELLTRAKGRVDRLIILNTIGFKKGFHPPFKFEPNDLGGVVYAKLYKSKLYGKGVMRKTLYNGTNKKKFSKADRKGYWLPMREGGHRAIYNFFITTCNGVKNYDTLYTNLKMPIKIIWGMKDDILRGEEQIPQFKALIPHLKEKDILRFTDAKHFIQEERPKEIVAFIQKNQ